MKKQKRYAKNLMEIAQGYPAKPEDPNGCMLTLEEAIEANRAKFGINSEMEENIRTMYAGLTQTELE